MKINEKEKLLLTVMAIVLVGVFYFMFLLPPVWEKAQDLKAAKIQMDKDILEAKEVIGQSDLVNEQYKELNARILSFCEKFFPKLEQERMILIIDQLLAESGLIGNEIVFNDAVNLGQEIYVPEKVADIKSLDDLPSQIVNVGYSGSFSSLLNFLGKVNNYSRKILVNKVNLINSSTKNNVSNLTGSVVLEFYAIPSFMKDTIAALTWEEDEDEIGVISDPFSGASLIDSVLGPSEIACDFVLTVKPITADLPTIVMGLDADISADSFVFADSPGVEDVELRLFMEDGKYLCSYKAGNESYPHNNSDKVEIPFATGNQRITMKIFSTPRTGEQDQSGANLSIYNETDLPLYVQIINDDELLPRVNIVEQTSNVIVE